MRVISWEEYITPHSSFLIPHSSFLAVTIGVFDGVHRGHQALIQRICAPPSPIPHSSLRISHSFIPTVVTFTQNPQTILTNGAYPGDILKLERKLAVLEGFGVELAVVIDFSEKFSRISGRDFIDLLLGSRPVKFIALGQDFRCGYGLDTGVEEICGMAKARGVEAWVEATVMDEGRPISSSRIREAVAAERYDEARRLLG